VSSLSQHDDKTIEYCQKNSIVYEAYEAMRTCPFKNPKALAIAKSHNASVAQVCLRWIMQKGCIMAVGTGSNAKEVAAYAVRGAKLALPARAICAVRLTDSRLSCCAQEENLGMYNITLTDADMAALNKM
jgi:diketogulonate reductase-like aldo/keto reductase